MNSIISKTFVSFVSFVFYYFFNYRPSPSPSLTRKGIEGVVKMNTNTDSGNYTVDHFIHFQETVTLVNKVLIFAKHKIIFIFKSLKLLYTIIEI